MFDVCVIGHATKDIVRIKNAEKMMPGGVAYYFSIALKSLGLNIYLITKSSKQDKYLLNNLYKEKIKTFYKESKETSYFENIYLLDTDIRAQNVKSVADSFCLEDIPNINSKIYHLGPLTKEDISKFLQRT